MNEIPASAAFKKFAGIPRTRYNCIVAGLSPVAPIVDVRATGHFIDTYVYAVAWGKTKVAVIECGRVEAGKLVRKQ